MRTLPYSFLALGLVTACARGLYEPPDPGPVRPDAGRAPDAPGMAPPDAPLTTDAPHPFAVDVPARDSGTQATPDTPLVDWRRDTGGFPGCRADGMSCGSGSECCGNRCTDDGRCAPETCALLHERCFRHSECCDGVACMGGFCGGPERTGTCAIDGVSCWAHTQCCSGVCNREGFCVAAEPPLMVCSPAFVGCLLSTSCCSNVCNPFTSACADPAPGPWLP
jgi:hypothetical protein